MLTLMVTGIRIWHFGMFTCIHVCVWKTGSKRKNIKVYECSYVSEKTQYQVEIPLNTVRIAREKTNK